MSVRATVYGKYFPGAIMKDRHSGARSPIRTSSTRTFNPSRRDLERAKIPLSALADWRVIYVGAGRQAFYADQQGGRL
jgi:hypothetical protein